MIVGEAFAGFRRLSAKQGNDCPEHGRGPFPNVFTERKISLV
jgi:hypothetical protein